MRLFDGVRVLDFSRMVAGPYLTAMMADLGADVIKIERPALGDDMRHIAPMADGESYLFMALNRGKRSVALDLKSHEARQIALDLMRWSDVVVENFRPGVADRLGIGYRTANQVNEGLIYASVSGFGQDGPLSSRPAYDHIAQAMGGIMSINGMPDGPPIRVGESIGDVVAGIFGAWAVAAALYGRERTGHGQHIDVAMMDSVTSLLVTAFASYFATGVVPGRSGNAHPVSAPLDAFRTRDGFIIIAVANNAMFERFATTIGDPALTTDPRFASDELRKRHEDELRARIEAWTSERDASEVESTLERASIPVGPVWDIGAVATSAHIRARNLFTEVTHPTAGPVTVPRQPARFDPEAKHTMTPPPRLGEHTMEVLTQILNLGETEIEALKRSSAIELGAD